MKYALSLSADGRILSATYAMFAPSDAVFVTALPEGDISDYRYVNGTYVYDPLPDQAPEENPEGGQTSLEARVAAVESDVASLTAAIEKGLNL